MPTINQPLGVGFPTLPWHCLAVPNRRLIFSSSPEPYVKDRWAIYLPLYLFLSIFLSARLHVGCPYCKQQDFKCVILGLVDHTANCSLCITMSCSLCVGCLFSSWSQVYIIYHQTKMTIVGFSGIVSRSIQLQLIKLKEPVLASCPSFPLLKTRPLAEARLIKHTWNLLAC